MKTPFLSCIIIACFISMMVASFTPNPAHAFDNTPSQKGDPVWEDVWGSVPDTEKASGDASTGLRYQLVPLTYKTHDLFKSGQFPMKAQLDENDREALIQLNEYCDRRGIQLRYDCYVLFGQNMTDHSLMVKSVKGATELDKVRGHDRVPLATSLGRATLGAVITPVGILLYPFLSRAVAKLGPYEPNTNVLFDFFIGIGYVPYLFLVSSPLSHISENRSLIKEEKGMRDQIVEKKTDQEIPFTLEKGGYFWRWILVKNGKTDIQIDINSPVAGEEKTFKHVLMPACRKAE